MATAEVRDALAAAARLSADGRFSEARSAFHQILQIAPGNRDALEMMGLLSLELGDLAPARACFQKIVAAEPRDSDSWRHLGETLKAAGDLREAESAFRQALRADDNSAAGHVALAMLLRSLGRNDEALVLMQRAVVLAPQDGSCLEQLGIALSSTGRHEQAVPVLQRAQRLRPESVSVVINLGNAQMAMGQAKVASGTYALACRLDPESRQAVYSYGVALAAQRCYGQALEAFSRACALAPDQPDGWYQQGNCLHHVGRTADAISCYRKTITLDSNHTGAWNNLMLALLETGKTAEALATGRQAVSSCGDSAEWIANFSRVLLENGHVQAAVDAARQAVTRNPEMAVAQSNLGRALLMQGGCRQAFEHCRRAAELAPDIPEIHSSLLFVAHYAGQLDPKRHFEMHRLWAHRFSRPPSAVISAPATEGRIRVGYVSPDFRAHPVTCFMEPIFRHHHRNRLHVHCYDDTKTPDAVNQRLRLLVETWRPVHGLSDDALFAAIRNDRIDILVDLAGHTAGNRLQMLSRKPAAVQATYLGYPNTTGQSAIDYRITDRWADPPETAEAIHTEKLVRLPGGFLCYQSPPQVPERGRASESENGVVTFGSFNNIAKISPETLLMWAQVLDAVDGSRLLIKFRSLGDGRTAAAFNRRLAAAGIDPQRVTLAGHCASLQAHFAMYHQVDIALDTYPYGGTTTTCDALWMGVPVVSRVGSSHVSRVGYSLLSRLGRGQWAAESSRQYVDIAVDLARQPALRQTLRHQLRAQMAESSLVAATTLVSQLEEAYFQMIQRLSADYPQARTDAHGRTADD